MSPNIIFVAGVHGVGKTTYCKGLSEKLEIPHFSASEIIRTQKPLALEADTKAVKDADGNQDILLKGINALNLKGKEILLDGHFVLMQNDKVTRIPLNTYKFLGISKILLLCDQPEKIYKRLNARDNNSFFTLELIDQMQKEEIKYAKEIAEILKIELEKINITEYTNKIEALRQAIIDGENSGESTPLDIEKIISKARQKKGLDD